MALVAGKTEMKNLEAGATQAQFDEAKVKRGKKEKILSAMVALGRVLRSVAMDVCA